MPPVASARSEPFWWSWVEESLEEAEFLWRHRARALVAVDQSLRDVGRFVEERLLGCIDGLRVAGDAAVERLLAPALAEGSPARVAVAAYALSAGGPASWACLIEALVRAEPPRRAAIVRGLELVWPDDLLPRLAERKKGLPPEVRAAALEIAAFRRRVSGEELEELEELLAIGDLDVRRAVLKAARFAPPHAVDRIIEQGLASPPPARAVAIEAGIVLGLPDARAACLDALGAPAKPPPQLLVLSALLDPVDQALARLLDAVAVEALAPAAVFALGFSGARSAADACVDLLRQDRQAPLACEAFCAITGLDLDAAGLRAPDAEPPAEPPDDVEEEEDQKSDLFPGAGADLPRADAAGVARWWDQNRARFQAEGRYRFGQPADRAGLERALAEGQMRRRHVLALELAIVTRGEVQINPRALYREQHEQLKPLQGAKHVRTG